MEKNNIIFILLTNVIKICFTLCIDHQMKKIFDFRNYAARLVSIYIARSKQAGFTLIELLIVIGILGILASALVATIDPFEQLKKGTDANVKNVAVEYFNGNMRYYMTHNSMPWNDLNNTAYQPTCVLAAGMNNDFPTAMNLNDTNARTGCIGALINDGELKTGFINATNVLSSILVSGTINGVTVCFQPQSKSQRSSPEAKWDNTGSATVLGCPNATATTCYWCTQ